MKKIWLVFVFICILSFGAENARAQTIVTSPIASPSATITPTITPVKYGVDYKTNKVCDPDVCSEIYGCMLNRCKATDMTVITSRCKPVGKGHDENCPRPKIILIPGYGASWNTSALMFGAKVKNGDWKMASFSKSYYSSFDDLMKNNDYALNKDYFIWYYDWRNPVAQIVNDFKTYYNSKFTANDRVIIVGHSLGGLVGRIFIHDNPLVKVDKLITVGTPHKGALSAYDAWVYGNEGDITDLSSFGLRSYLIMKMFINNQFKGSVSKAGQIQKLVPMLKDIMPEFNFIKYKNKFNDYTKWEIKNDYLIAKNKEKNWDLKGKMYSIIGNGNITKETITLLEKLGKTFGFSKNGDGVVLKSSAGIGSSIVEIKNGVHANLMNEGIDKIAGILGLKTIVKLSVKSLSDNYSPIIFYAYQGVNMMVKCDNGNAILADEFGMVNVSAKNKTCKVSVKADKTGTIRIIIGRVDRGGDWIVKKGTAFEIKTELLNDKIKSDDLTVGSGVKNLIKLPGIR